MKLFAVIFLLFTNVNFLHAQDYERYHHGINAAETYLVADKIDSVFHYYDKTFLSYEYVFIKDVLLASQIAWKHKDTFRTQRYLIKGASCGLQTNCLNDIPILVDYMSTRHFNSTYDSMKAAVVKNKFYNEAMASEWRDREGELGMSEDQSEFISAVQRNVERVKALLKQGIFPGEKYIGVSTICKDLYNTNVFNSLANYDCVMTELHEPLWKAVKRGELHPREYAMLYEWELIRSANSMNLITSTVFRLSQKQKIYVALKENEYRKNNPSCDRKKQQPKLFGIYILPTEINQEEINENRKAAWMVPTTIDAQKAALQSKYGYVFYDAHR